MLGFGLFGEKSTPNALKIQFPEKNVVRMSKEELKAENTLIDKESQY